MEEINQNQIRANLLSNDSEFLTNSQRGRRAYTTIDLPQQAQQQQQNSLSLNLQPKLNNGVQEQNARPQHRYSVGANINGNSPNYARVGNDEPIERQQQIAQNPNHEEDENHFEGYNENEIEGEEDENEIYDMSNFQMSSLFISIFKDNRLFIVAVIICDAVMGAVAQIVYQKRCDMSDLQYWNLQWSFYFFAKAVYHSLIFIQFFSENYKLDICQKLGEFRSPEENSIREFDYQSNYTDRQRSQIRRSLERQFLDYYYKRTSLLKWSFYLKSLVTLSYVIYGFVVFFKGNYFSIWISNTSNSTTESCDYALTWWVYLSIIFVIASNRQIFDLILIIVIIIPILIFVYLPYWAYKNCQKKRKRKLLFKNFKTIKFSVGKVQGDTECTICRMDYIIDEPITILPCNELHHFHKDCIHQWLNVNLTCPLCRHNFGVEEGENEEEEAQAQAQANINNNNLQQANLYVPPLPPLPNQNGQQQQQQGQLLFYNNQNQQQQQQQQQQQYLPQNNVNNNLQQNNNGGQLPQFLQGQPQQQQQQSHLDQQMWNFMIELVSVFSNLRDLQIFMEENQYSPEFQAALTQLWQQRRAGLV